SPDILLRSSRVRLLQSPCAPVQKARYKRVRCRPDAWSPNCIEEKAPWLLPHGGANRILPPVADPSPMKSDQMSDIFPLSEEESGSGLDTDTGDGAGLGLRSRGHPGPPGCPGTRAAAGAGAAAVGGGSAPLGPRPPCWDHPPRSIKTLAL
uniref:Serglycin n=1 Tax=Anas platyrhynchos TaxID=8839 RepID=A0A8B9R1L9_ANAPL